MVKVYRKTYCINACSLISCSSQNNLHSNTFRMLYFNTTYSIKYCIYNRHSYILYMEIQCIYIYIQCTYILNTHTHHAIQRIIHYNYELCSKVVIYYISCILPNATIIMCYIYTILYALTYIKCAGSCDIDLHSFNKIHNPVS